MSLVVEDGTIVANANSYLAVAEADTLVVGHELESVWTALTTLQKETYLVRGTRYLDLTYHFRWAGRRVSRDQSLDFPRWEIQIEGFSYNSNVIPPQLKKATLEAALRSAQGATLIPDSDPTSNAGSLTSERIRVGPIEEELQYSGGVSRKTQYPIIDRVLMDLVETGGDLMERG